MIKGRDLTEEKLIELGFIKEVVEPEESLEDKPYHYYAYELYNGECLITQTNDERKDEFYDAEFFMMDSAGSFHNSVQISDMIKMIKSGT